MTTIRVVSQTPAREKWDASEHWTRVFRYMSHDGKGRWHDLQLVPPQQAADWTVVVNHADGAHERELVRDPRRALILQKEDAVVRAYLPAMWARWSDHTRWAACWNYPEPGRWEPFDWWVILPHVELAAGHPAKSKLLSAVQSGKEYYPGHKLRRDFVTKYLADFPGFDLYGRDRYDCACYRGRLDDPLYGRAKNSGLLPYRYHFLAENAWEPHYFSEKLADAWVAECLPFYWGCPDLETFFPSEAFVRLPIEDGTRALAMLKEAIQTDQWTKRLPAIREAKRLCLEKYNQWCCVETLLSEVQR